MKTEFTGVLCSLIVPHRLNTNNFPLMGSPHLLSDLLLWGNLGTTNNRHLWTKMFCYVATILSLYSETVEIIFLTRTYTHFFPLKL